MNIMRFTTIAAVSALLAGSALAQTAETAAPETLPGAEPEIAAVEPRFNSKEEMTVGDVIGMVAYDPEGDRIAEIDYVVMESDTLLAILGIGGFLGLGEHTVALPFEEFQLREDGLGFVLSTDKETLKQVPEIDEDGLQSLPAETPIAELLPEGAGDTGASQTTSN